MEILNGPASRVLGYRESKIDLNRWTRAGNHIGLLELGLFERQEAKKKIATYEIGTLDLQDMEIAKEPNETHLDVMINPRLPDWGRGIGYFNCRPIEQSFNRETELARLR